MPLQRVGPDSNGLYYNALSTSEWQGAYGDQLRAAGYTYCGFGTWGVYVAAPGEPCSSSGAGGGGGVLPGGGGVGGPQILPTYQPFPADNQASSGSGCCGSRGVMPGAPRTAGAPAPAPGGVDVTVRRDELERIPRWLWWVLIVLVLIVLLRG